MINFLKKNLLYKKKKKKNSMKSKEREIKAMFNIEN